MGPRSFSQKTFSVELGNNEGNRNLDRNYEATIVIDPVKVHFEHMSDTASASESDTHSFTSTMSNYALEILENASFTEFDASKITSKKHTNREFEFEKNQFQFWYESGVIELPVECTKKGSWKIITRLDLTINILYSHFCEYPGPTP